MRKILALLILILGFSATAHSQGVIIRYQNSTTTLGQVAGGTTTIKCDGTSVVCTFTGGVFTITSTGGGGAVSSVFGRTGAVVAATNDYNFNQLAGSAACAQLPALTGDTTTTAGTCATVNVALNGVNLAALGTGILKNTTATGHPSIAVGSDLPTAIPIASVGSAGLSGTSPITISAAGTIGCATCNTTSANVNSVSGDGVLFTNSASTGAVTLTLGTTNGTGNFVRTTSPTLVTPTLGAASATSVTTTGTTSGFWAGAQGPTSSAVAPCNVANSICEQAPTSVTSYLVTKPGTGPAVNNMEKSYTALSSSATTESFVNRSQSVALTGTYTNATTGFTNVTATTNLAFTLDASTTYSGYCSLYYSASAVTAGPKIEFTGPASPTSVLYGSQFQLTATPTYLEPAGATAYSTSLTASTAVTATTVLHVRIDFGIVNGTNAGTLQLLAAANGSGTVTIEPGSSCRMQGN